MSEVTLDELGRSSAHASCYPFLSLATTVSHCRHILKSYIQDIHNDIKLITDAKVTLIHTIHTSYHRVRY